jgi:hypothetical protein
VGRQGKHERRLSGRGRNVRLADALGALQAAGFECEQGSRGHWLCRHRAAGVVVTVAPPHGRENKLLPAYVKATREALAAVEQWEQEQEEDHGDPH